MEPDHRRVQQVEIDYVDSAFLARFTTAQPAPSYLMREVDVTWPEVLGPRLAPTKASGEGRHRGWDRLGRAAAGGRLRSPRGSRHDPDSLTARQARSPAGSMGRPDGGLVGRRARRCDRRQPRWRAGRPATHGEEHRAPETLTGRAHASVGRGRIPTGDSTAPLAADEQPRHLRRCRRRPRR
jgi:hypothetical protein